MVELDSGRVPPTIASLLTLARRWGIPDDGLRSDAILLAVRDEDTWAEVERWLIGPEASAVPPSREYVAITCLTMAADQARLRLTKLVKSGGAATDEQAASAPAPRAGDGPKRAWPTELLNTLRLGRRLVTEVPARPGRRAFVHITPTTNDQDRLAEQERWTRSNRNRAFRVEHWDYDEQMIDGWDYNIGAKLVRTATARDEQVLLELIGDWGLRPTDFTYPWNTADPK